MVIALGILIPTVLLLFTGHPIALIWSCEGGGRQHGDEMDAISSRVQLILLFSASSPTSLSPSCLFSFVLALCSTLHILKVAASIEKSTNFVGATVILERSVYRNWLYVWGKAWQSILLHHHVQLAVRLQLTVRHCLLTIERQFCHISSLPCGHYSHRASSLPVW